MTKYRLEGDGAAEAGAPVFNGRYAQKRFDSLEAGSMELVNRCDCVQKLKSCYTVHSQDCLAGSANSVYQNFCIKNGAGKLNPAYIIDLDDDDDKSNNNFSSNFRRQIRRGCSLKVLKKRIPIIEWLPKYSWKIGFSDLIAGFTVGLTVIPQAIAYANVAGLPPQYGLYSSFMACFIYTIFGSCKDSAVGPTAIAAILTHENLHSLGPEFAVLLCFLSGCVELLMGIFRLGSLVDFVSGPVSVGFTSAAAIIIASSQVKDIFGLKFSGGNFVDVWIRMIQNIHDIRLWDTVLGVTSIVLLLVLRKVKDISIGGDNEKGPSSIAKITSSVLWFLSIGRNIIVVVISAAIAYAFQDQKPFILTGEVKKGLPDFTFPPFETVVDNQTYSFIDMASSMGSALFVVPLLSILENIALAKAFSEGKPIDATQEMIAIGLCNIGSSFVGSMPVSGALSRGAVNNASGVKTTFGGIYTGIIVLVSLQYLTPCFYYIPKSALAAVIITAVIFMVEFHVFKPIWRTKKSDILPLMITFLTSLFVRLEYGIFIGVGVNIIFLLHASARPHVEISKVTSIPSGIDYLLVTPDRSLSFPSADYVRNLVSKAGIKQASSRLPVVLDATHIQYVDFTSANGIKSLINDFYSRDQLLIFYNMKPSVNSTFLGVKPQNFKLCMSAGMLDGMLQEHTYNNQSISVVS